MKKVDGVKDASADCHAGTATVKYDSKKADIAKLIDSLKGTKYTASEQKKG